MPGSTGLGQDPETLRGDPDERPVHLTRRSSTAGSRRRRSTGGPRARRRAGEPGPTRGEQTYRGSGRLEGRKALVTGGDSGIGRRRRDRLRPGGRRRGARICPEEEPDAKEVVELIDRRPVARPSRCRATSETRRYCRDWSPQPSSSWAGWTSWSTTPASRVSQDVLNRLTTEQFDADLQDQRLRDVLDHQGGAAAPAGRVVDHQHRRRSRPTSPRRTCSTTPDQGAIVTFTKALAKQLAPKGIRVNAVAPGPDLDAAQPGGGQPHGKLREFGARRRSAGRPARRARPGLRLPRVAGVELRHRRDPATSTAGRRPPDRSEGAPMNPTGITANLSVADQAEARDFYVGFLGLSVEGFNLGWVVNLQSPDGRAVVQLVTRDATSPVDSVISVHVGDEVEAAYEEAQRRGFEIVHPLTTEPWGVRRFSSVRQTALSSTSSATRTSEGRALHGSAAAALVPGARPRSPRGAAAAVQEDG